MLRPPLSGEVTVFMCGLFPFCPEGLTKSITQQASVTPQPDDYNDILEEESVLSENRLLLLSPTVLLKWVFC